MVEFNLLPWRERRRTRSKQHFLYAITGVGLGVALLLCGGQYMLRQRLAVQVAQNDTLSRQLAEMEPLLDELRALREHRVELDQRSATLQILHEKRAHDALLLDALVHALPDGAHYTALAREGEAVRLSGMATGVELTALMQTLGVSPYFSAPELQEITAPDEDVTSRSAFVLAVPLRIAEEGAP